MPIRLEDSSEFLEHAGHEVTTRAKRMWSGFTDFALQDNVLEVAVGLMYVIIVLNHFIYFFLFLEAYHGCLFSTPETLLIPLFSFKDTIN
jgi:hypothetical protein